MQKQLAVTAFEADSLPQIFLNHFYVVLDSRTYRAIEEDTFLRQHFAVNERRTTVRSDQTYTGLYFYGTNTYFEFFDIANSPRPYVGDTGIAFGVEQLGAIDALTKVRHQEFEPDTKLVTRLFQDKQVPWFFMATSRSLPYESGMSSWVMQYHSDFLTYWHPDSRQPDRGIRRSDILKRYSKVLDAMKEPALEDVTSLTVAADTPTTNSLVHFCSQLGYRIEKQEGGVVVLRGIDFVLLVLPATENVRGVREIRMQVLTQREMERQCGNSVLWLSGNSALWSFYESEVK